MTDEKTVLIVDDVDYSRQLLRNAILSVANNEDLKTKRFKFVNASNGQDAFAKIEAHKPDLIFLDIELPDINGIDVLKRIKSEAPQAFVIMVSGESTIANVKGSLTNGAAGFIVKPFSAIKVSEALRNYEKKKFK
jgi:two-component system chemotaxis response regulator CheY